MDTGYNALYTVLRPDQKRHLISYPYYTKYADGANSIFFPHLDLNVPKFLRTGRGGDIVQGSVSLNDELESACTVLVPGFHKKIRQWWMGASTRGEILNGFVP